MGKRKYKYEIPDELDKEIQREMGTHSVKVKELTDEQVDELIHRAESGKLRSEDVDIIRWGFKTLSWLYRLLVVKTLPGTKPSANSNLILSRRSCIFCLT